LQGDWSSDVCSSDLGAAFAGGAPALTQVTVTGNTAAVTYEVWYSNANILESMNLAISAAAISNTGQNLPATGTSQVAVNFAPTRSEEHTSELQSPCN